MDNIEKTYGTDPRMESDPARTEYQRATAPLYTSPMGIEPWNTPAGFNRQSTVLEFKSWAYGLSMLNAKAVASVPFKLYVRDNKKQKCLFSTRKINKQQSKYLAGEWRDRNGQLVRPSNSVQKAFLSGEFSEVTEDHPITNLLNAPNPWFTRSEFFALNMIYMQMVGDTYQYALRDERTGIPSELWPLPAQDVKVVPGLPGQPWILKYRSGRNQSRWVYFDPDVIINIPNLTRDPADLYYGQGFVESAWQSLKLDQSKQALEQNYVANSARPDWVAFVGTGDEDAVTRFEAQVNAKLRGYQNTGRFMAIGATAEQVEFQRMNFPNEIFNQGSMATGGTARSPLVEQMAFIWGVPLSKVFSNDPNRANAATGEYVYSKDTVLPYCTLFEEKWNEQLIPMFGLTTQDCFIAFDNPVPRDNDLEVRKVQILVNAGAMTRNELRGWADMETKDDEFYDEPTINDSITGKPEEEVYNENGESAKPGEDVAASPDTNNQEAK